LNDDHKFQKNLAYHQIGATVAASVGAVILTMGIAMIVFSWGIAIESLDKESEMRQDLQKFEENMKGIGRVLSGMGFGTMFGGITYFMYLIHRQK